MKRLPPLLIALVCPGCGAGADPLLGNPDRAPIESYVLALPPYAFHEESTEDFRKRVMSSRSLPRNRGGNPDSLHCEGDGSYPAREFTLDRASHTLTIRTLSDEESVPGGTVAMKRESGKWIRVSPPH